MQDKLDKFIEDHRSEFDLYDPPVHVWPTVSRKLERQTTVEPRRYLVAAACVFLIVTAFIWFTQVGTQPPLAVQKAEVSEKSEIRDAEAYYTSMVANSRAQIDKYRDQFPDLCKDFAKEIDTLNILYGGLKTEYRNSAGNEAVLQAMIENLQVQVDILKRQLQVLSAIKQKENRTGDKAKFI